MLTLLVVLQHTGFNQYQSLCEPMNCIFLAANSSKGRKENIKSLGFACASSLPLISAWFHQGLTHIGYTAQSSANPEPRELKIGHVWEEAPLGDWRLRCSAVSLYHCSSQLIITAESSHTFNVLMCLKPEEYNAHQINILSFWERKAIIHGFGQDM